MAHCRLFKAVQETIPEWQPKRIESKEDVAKAVQELLEKDNQQQPKGVRR